MTTPLTQLRHLAQAYFHQDYDIEFSDAAGAVAAFASAEERGAICELLSEIDALLQVTSSETLHADLWIKKVGAAYDPHEDGETYREWFRHIQRSVAD